MAGQNANNIDQFDAYFRKADLDGDGQISGAEAVAFFQGSNLPKQVLAQVWAYADQRKAGFLNRSEFYNALKLVTVAQSKRELTPDIVKAALYGPASSKIPAPQINLGAAPAPQSRVGASTPQLSGAPSASPVVSSSPQNTAVRGPQGPGNASLNQQFVSPLPNQFMRPPHAIPVATTPRPQQVVATQSMPSGGTTAASSPLTSNMSTDWLGGGTGALGGTTSQVSTRGISPPTTQDQFGLTASNLTPPVQPRSSATSGQMSAAPSKPLDANSKALAVSGNGFPSDSLFGNVFSTTSVQTKQNSTAAVSSAVSLPVSQATTQASYSPQAPVKPSPLESFQGTVSSQSVGGQYQQNHPAAKQNQQFASPRTNANNFNVGPANSTSTQSQTPWPKMTQAAVQKYTKVFMQVDTDRDGKISGEQARNLFLSWRLPREILKQVWDLSDQDNDSMLSLKEFCTALYLMERFREGRPLPVTLPSSILPDEALFSTMGRPTTPHGTAPWAHVGGLQQSQSTRPPVGKPPRPVTVSHADKGLPPVPQKPKIPVLEKHLVDQLSSEEQESLNAKLKEATDADKKVEELEKVIVTAKEKIEFYHAKMQELIIYKSRCDNRLNEIIERVAADKREVEALSKRYEEKYKQAGDVASRLSIEEATFRDIQEKKMEMYKAIVKMEADSGNGDLQQRVDHIQTGLEELVKNLNERCKQYGLRAKPTSLAELPFGWQPGIQEGTADWDEDWDKFEDAGFTFVKELTLDVQNVIAPPKQKSLLVQKALAATNEDSNVSSSTADTKTDKVTNKGEGEENDLVHGQEDGMAKSPSESPGKTVAGETQSQEVQDSQTRNLHTDGSPHAKDTRSEQGGAESVFSGDKTFDDSGWGTYDTSYDTDSVWGFDADNAKDLDNDRHDSLFGPDFSLKPIKTEPSRGNNSFQGKSSSIFADSVPSTPAYSIGGSPRRFSTGPDDYSFDKGKFSSIFADSVPSTPAYSIANSPRRFSDDHSFDTFSRFDSFNMHDGGLFQSPRHSLARFDSVRSSSDSDQGLGQLPKFDSFNAHDAGGLFQSSQSSVARFDSFRSSKDSDHGFPSFDDTDPFRSTGPFRMSLDSQTPKRGLDADPFASTGPFRSSFDSETPKKGFDTDPFGSTGPFRSSFDSETPKRGLDTDPFGSTAPFMTSVDSQTPRKSFEADIFGSSGPFKTSVESQTAKKCSEKKDYDTWSAF